jgi:hypothetical protein
MTSLTPKEARVVHKLHLFASNSPQFLMVKDHRQLIRQLYRFNYFYPSKKKRVKVSENWLLGYEKPEGTLQTTARQVQEWFTRPDALKAPEAPPRPPSPTPMPQPQSPLYSILPTEIREYIFKLVVTSYPEDDYYFPNTTPAITSVCRLVRQEMLHLFFKHNHFTFATTNQSNQIAVEDPIKWLYGMRQHLPKIHQITFFVEYFAMNDGPNHGHISVTIRHDPAQGCWATTCEDDWSIEKPGTIETTPDERNALERDGDLLCGIMRTMVDERSRADLSPEYLMWLMRDAATFYVTEKVKGNFALANSPAIWHLNSVLGPSVMPPPDMYSTDVGYDQLKRFNEVWW